MHLFICFFVTDFVRKMGACPGLAKKPLIPFKVQKWTFCLIAFPSSINDDCTRGCYGRPLLQAWLLLDLNSIPNKILISPVVLVLAYGERGLWFESCPDPYISAMHLFIGFFVTHFVRKNNALFDVRHCCVWYSSLQFRLG